ncbi:DUF3631 domain-containing protein [Nocardioides hwasunensis]|uniref:DUF3631 domain-containing protein n=1 Tax=Nocardioides hwasunensis TaxID=397258 RepID=A0ABR8MIK9_9ACTN|nr:DUF3631 domain-containing protein [Nocardioides hwasunensis]MBD3915897.1 DUF3631 domain-containing protein [Nocardioides hwasunensis]
MTHDPAPLDAIHTWLERFIVPTEPHDLDALTLWAAHTHFLDQIDSSARLVLMSALPESGKTTALEHLERLTANPHLMANAPTAPLMARLATGQTLLIDEADMHVASGRGSHGDLYGIVNAGYRRGGSYVVLEQPPGGGAWVPTHLPVYGAVALAGISPSLPTAFASRCVFVHLSPDVRGEAEETLWGRLTHGATALGDQLTAWAKATTLPSPETVTLPTEARGRTRELYGPLMAVSLAAGGTWPDRCTHLVEQALADREADRADATEYLPPHILIIRDIYGIWHLADPDCSGFARTGDLLKGLHEYGPDAWGHLQGSRPALTPQRLGNMLRKHGIRPTQLSTGERERGYEVNAFRKAWEALDLPPIERSLSITDVPT